jgi:hypothetical protein
VFVDVPALSPRRSACRTPSRSTTIATIGYRFHAHADTVSRTRSFASAAEILRVVISPCPHGSRSDAQTCDYRCNHS